MQAPALESRDLVLMCALARHGGVTRAAKALALTQSAVSHHLARLESKLGLLLFDRVGRGLRITPAGRRLAEGGSEVIDQIRALERSLTPVAQTRIRLTAQCHTAYDWLGTVLGGFSRTHPDTRIVVKVAHTREPLEALRDRQIDLAICHIPPRRGMFARPLGVDPFVFVLPPDHAAAASETVRPAQVKDDTLIVHDVPTQEMRAMGKAFFGKNAPRRVVRLPVTEAIVELVASGYGVGMMPRWTSRQARRRTDVVVRTIRKKNATREWRAVMRKADEGREDLSAFVEELATWFATR